MRKQVTVEINNPRRDGHYEKPVAPVRVLIALEADTIEHASQDLDAAHQEALMQFEAHQKRSGRAGTTPTDAAPGPKPVYRDIRDAAARASAAAAAVVSDPDADLDIQLRPDDGDDAA